VKKIVLSGITTLLLYLGVNFFLELKRIKQYINSQASIKGYDVLFSLLKLLLQLHFYTNMQFYVNMRKEKQKF